MAKNELSTYLSTYCVYVDNFCGYVDNFFYFYFFLKKARKSKVVKVESRESRQSFFQLKVYSPLSNIATSEAELLSGNLSIISSAFSGICEFGLASTLTS